MEETWVTTLSPCFHEAMSGDSWTLCFNAMKEEIKLLAKIHVCDLVDLPKGVVAIDCK
jgi:hypothetical protein